MSKWIDADALKIPSEEIIAKMIINSAPSIDIVRCKECRWLDCDSLGTYCDRYRWTMDEDDFCSRGERREP